MAPPALLARAPNVLTRFAHCWVASPLSVSQLLDGGKRHFNIVIFDEQAITAFVFVRENRPQLSC